MTKINDKRSARYVSLSLILILAVSACCSACGAAAPDDGEALAPTTRDKQIATSFARLLEGRHVSKIKIDEAVSERSFELFLKAIDPTKLYFNQSDVELFAAQYAKTMALQAKTGVVTPAFDMYRVYLERVDERCAIADKLLEENQFDFTVDEELVRDKKALTYPKTQEEVVDRMRKRVKFEILSLEAEERDKNKDAEEKTRFSTTKLIARIAIFGAMASILYVVELFTIKLPFFPSFLSLHFDEVPAFIAGFAYGPVAGLGVLVIKTIIKLPFTSTATVGEFGDLLLSSIYLIPVCLIYKKQRNLKGVAIGFSVGTVLQVIAGMVLNVYLYIPFYSMFYNIPMEGLLKICQLANPAITDVGWSYAVMAVLPFNLLKDAIVIVVTFLVYRSIHVFLRFNKNN